MSGMQQLVADAAAQLFWRLAEEVGIASAAEDVLATNGAVLFKQPFTQSALAEYGLSAASPDQRRAFFGAVAAEAVSSCRDERNMNGVVYVEDLQSGRSPTAQAVDTRPVLHTPKRIDVRGRIDTLGRLCLRHPLPAVVAVDHAPRSAFLAVADTATALGKQLPMFFSGSGIQQVEDDLFILTGIFHIPVPSAAVGDRWGRVIQNSSCFVTQMGGQSDTGPFNISFDW